MIGAQPENYCFDEIRPLLRSGESTLCRCETGRMWQTFADDDRIQRA